MKWLKISIVIIIIIITVITGILIFKLKNEVPDVTPEIERDIGEISVKPEVVENYMYFTADECSNKILSYIYDGNAEAVYNLLDVDYINESKITQNNIFDILQLSNIGNYKTSKMYSVNGERYSKYYLRIATSKGYKYLNINLDKNSSVFNFRVLDENEFKIALNSNVSINDESIEKNMYNSIPKNTVTTEGIIEKYFIDFINTAIELPEEAYELLDERYKNARFENVDEFKEYLNENTTIQEIYTYENTNVLDYESYDEYAEAVKRVKLEKYSEEKNDDYIQYIYEDTKGNNYIFYVTSMMQYSVILDTYSIDIDEFTNKYNNSSNQEKVILNLNKIESALNNKDYRYIYNNVLASSFKTNNFSTLESFEDYARNNFPSNCKFEYIEFDNETGAYYTYKVRITDKMNKAFSPVEKTFIIQLGEGTDFKVSFNK